MREFSIGRIAGLEIRLTVPSLLGFGLLWALTGWLGFQLLELPSAAAVLAGLGAAALHCLAGLIHHLSHAYVARRTGYPMQAVRFGRWLVLATSIYPAHEPELPAAVHIRRALGGPIGSLFLGLLAGGAALLLRQSGGPAYWLALFVSADSLLVFTAGVLLPLGFTDMSTILRWWGR